MTATDLSHGAQRTARLAQRVWRAPQAHATVGQRLQDHSAQQMQRGCTLEHLRRNCGGQACHVAHAAVQGEPLQIIQRAGRGGRSGVVAALPARRDGG